MRVLGISGSLRRDSHNTKLLRLAGELIESRADAEFAIFDGLKAVPPYDEDDDVEAGPPAVEDLRRAIDEADAIVFSTPEYNSSVPGQLKNAVDWASRPKSDAVLRNKVVAVLGASTGMFGAVWAQAELRKVLAAAGARVVEGEVAVGHAHERFDENGRLNDSGLEQALEDTLGLLLAELAPASAAA